MDFNQMVNMDALDILEKYDIAEEEAYDVALEVNKRYDPVTYNAQRRAKAEYRAKNDERIADNTLKSYQHRLNETLGEYDGGPVPKEYFSPEARERARRYTKYDINKNPDRGVPAAYSGVTHRAITATDSKEYGNLSKNGSIGYGYKMRARGAVPHYQVDKTTKDYARSRSRLEKINDPSFRPTMHSRAVNAEMSKQSPKMARSAKECVMDTAMELMHMYDITTEEAVDMAMSYVGEYYDE